MTEAIFLDIKIPSVLEYRRIQTIIETSVKYINNAIFLKGNLATGIKRLSEYCPI